VVTNAPPSERGAALAEAAAPRDVRLTTCCVVGAGPAGAVLALLLARQGIPVVLLEAHGDLDRDFRGDTVHPGILEALDAVGVADRLLAAVPHRALRSITVPTEPPVRLDFGRLRTRFPFIAVMRQAQFLAFLTAEAARSPAFELVLRADVRELVEADGLVRGVRYRSPDGWHEVRALLTVGADGRFSRVRQRSGLRAVPTSQPVDILWFRLPRRSGDPEGLVPRVGAGHFLLLVDRGDQWQIAAAIPKGTYPEQRAAGLEALRRIVAALVPWLADRVDALDDWRRVALLSVTSDRLERWYRPGLLLIGDAAHVMSPFGGNGINYAVQDAVAAANRLSAPLRAGRLSLRDLAAVQRRRDWPTRLTQAAVALAQDALFARVLRAARTAGPPRPLRPPGAVRLLLRVPVLRELPLRWVAFGLWPVRVSDRVARGGGPAAAGVRAVAPAGGG
jgi:2-polyprenyl-6-methoxyphenol hydroxylase-like FAD-dependent oxidoreductase